MKLFHTFDRNFHPLFFAIRAKHLGEITGSNIEINSLSISENTIHQYLTQNGKFVLFYLYSLITKN